MQEHQRLAREIENLTKGIASGGDIPALAIALQERDKRLKVVAAQLAKPVVIPDRDVLKAALEPRTANWRDILRGPHIAQARVVLQHLIDLPIRIVTVDPPDYIKRDMTKRGIKPPYWVAAARPEGLTVGLIQSVASPTGHATSGCFGPFQKPQNANKSSKSGVGVIEGAIPMHIYRPRDPARTRKVA